jgi:DNA-binding NtrC family response regulator
MDERSVLWVMFGGAAQPPVAQLHACGWRVHAVADLRAAARQAKSGRFLVGVLADGGSHDERCMDIEQFVSTHGDLEWVGAFDAGQLASERCRDLIVQHLFDHHTLPVDAPRLAHTLGHAYGHTLLRRRDRAPEVAAPQTPIVGCSDAVREMLRHAQRIAKADAPVLIRGESGSGKELAAQEIHRRSRRAQGPFMPVNCGAIQGTLIQSELFGHVKGAFTGADRDKRGLIEAASDGTLFLDEIGDLSLALQINLLRFLQEKNISRVGSAQSVSVDVRVLAATHVNLEEAVAAGQFREDLYYRLNVLALHVPPLRERKSDIPLLADHFFRRFSDERAPQLRGFSHSAIAAMQEHHWPGNVRELINRVRRAMVMAEGRLVTAQELAFDTARTVHREPLGHVRERAERLAVFESLQAAGRNVTQAAKRLGVSRMTLYRLMSKHGIVN